MRNLLLALAGGLLLLAIVHLLSNQSAQGVGESEPGHGEPVTSNGDDSSGVERHPDEGSQTQQHLHPEITEELVAEFRDAFWRRYLSPEGGEAAEAYYDKLSKQAVVFNYQSAKNAVDQLRRSFDGLCAYEGLEDFDALGFPEADTAALLIQDWAFQLASFKSDDGPHRAFEKLKYTPVSRGNALSFPAEVHYWHITGKVGEPIPPEIVDAVSEAQVQALGKYVSLDRQAFKFEPSLRRTLEEMGISFGGGDDKFFEIAIPEYREAVHGRIAVQMQLLNEIRDIVATIDPKAVEVSFP